MSFELARDRPAPRRAKVSCAVISFDPRGGDAGQAQATAGPCSKGGRAAKIPPPRLAQRFLPSFRDHNRFDDRRRHFRHRFLPYYLRWQMAGRLLSVPAPTITHSVSPWRSGRTPTSLKVSLLIPVPIKKSVTLRPILPSRLRIVNAELKAGASVLSAAAKQKQRMNQGHCIRALLFRMTAVAIDRGTIQSARASLTVAPTPKAVGPYLAVAPTTAEPLQRQEEDHT
jgi:hypothetical protein